MFYKWTFTPFQKDLCRINEFKYWHYICPAKLFIFNDLDQSITSLDEYFFIFKKVRGVLSAFENEGTMKPHYLIYIDKIYE